MKGSRFMQKVYGRANLDQTVENNYDRYWSDKCPVCGKRYDTTGFEQRESRHYFKHRMIYRCKKTTYCYIPKGGTA